MNNLNLNITELKKTCKVCGEIKPLNEFYKLKCGKFGVDYRCKDCKKLYNKQWNKENPEYNKIYSKEWRNNNKHDDLYIVFNNEYEALYAGSTTQGIKQRISIHKSSNTDAGMHIKSGAKVMYYRLDEYDLNSNELRYLEQQLIDTLEPTLNKNNACVEFDYINPDRFAYLLDIFDTISNNKWELYEHKRDVNQ